MVKRVQDITCQKFGRAKGTVALALNIYLKDKKSRFAALFQIMGTISILTKWVIKVALKVNGM